MAEWFESLKYTLICDTCGNIDDIYRPVDRMKEIENQPCKRPWCTGHYKLAHLEAYGYDYNSEDPNNRRDSILRAIRESFFDLPTFDREAYKAECLLCEKEQAESQQKSTGPKCPNCGSTVNIQRISTASRAVSVFAFGLASSKIGKQYQCNSCKHKW